MCKRHTHKNNNNNKVYLAVELVCNSAGQSAAFPPTADPCQMCEGVVEVPEGTHSQAGEKMITS